MLVIYHSYGGACAMAAAALHLDAVPANDHLLPSPIGRGGGPGLRLQGRDPQGHTVYTLARNVPGEIIDRAFLGLASVFKLAATEFMLVDAAPPGEGRAFWLAWALAHSGRPAAARRLLLALLHRRSGWLAARVRETHARLAALAEAQP